MDLKQLLTDGSKQLGIDLEIRSVEQFMKFKDLLLEWNKVMNLTAITEEREVVVKHFLDSLTVLKYTELAGRVIDIGTGAGFPGIPIKIARPYVEITLMDSLNKRINFLEEVKKELGLDGLEMAHGRAEDLGVNAGYREKYDFCLSRAVANLSTLCEYCLPFVKVGGYFISLKGPKGEEEISQAKKAIEILGAKFEKIENVDLPFEDVRHNLVFIKKVKQTPTSYPRKAGKPSKDPIK